VTPAHVVKKHLTMLRMARRDSILRLVF
jgi:hypothetical protein